VIREVVYDDSQTPQVERVTSFDFGLALLSQTITPYSGGQPQTPETVWLLMDGHGSTRLVTTSSGVIAQSSGVNQVYHYDAYGNALGFVAGAGCHARIAKQGGHAVE